MNSLSSLSVIMTYCLLRTVLLGWVSLDGTRMNYWGGATVPDKISACGVTNSCSNCKKCNCNDNGSGWRQNSGLLTDKNTLPVGKSDLET